MSDTKTTKESLAPESNLGDLKEFYDQQIINVPQTILDLENIKNQMKSDPVLSDTAELVDEVIKNLRKKCVIANAVLNEARLRRKLN